MGVTSSENTQTFREVYGELKALGTAQNIKIYRRHGAPETMFGVSFANLGKLKKRIKRDHKLAVKLWATGNMDARILATMIVDPDMITEQMIDAWVQDLDYLGTADYLVTGALMPTPYAKKRWPHG